MLKVMTACYGGNAFLAENLRPLIDSMGMRLFTLHEWGSADIKWEISTWLDHLRQADIIICPSNYKIQPEKSANRLTQAMALGKPVICSPLRAYLDVLNSHPGSCLIADTPEEWKEKLTLLRDNPSIREEISKKALIASQSYSIDAMGQKWANLFCNNLSTDKVDIVIPVYTGTCLKMCLDSIRACTTDIGYNIIVVNNGPNEETHKYLEQQKDIIYKKTGPMTFAKAVNIGIKAGKEKYVCILNDDIIASKGWLSELVNTCKRDPSIGAVGPLSNCDKGWLNSYDITIKGVQLLPGVNTIEQITPIIPDIYSFKSPYSEMPERDWVAYYCTLIPRAVIDKVGVLNEEYINSGEDVDHCNRIKKQGYKIVQNYKSFIMHFGAVSRKGLEKVDYEKYHKDDARTQGILSKIWSKKSVLLYSGPSFETWDFRNVDHGGIGGSETWQVCLARELDKLGYRVTVMCDCPEPGIKDGNIEYWHYSQYADYVDQYWIDYFISSRTTDTLKFPVRAGKIFVMCHDVWLLNGKDQPFTDRVKKYCTLSEWHRDFFSDYHSIPKDKIVLTSNGIDFERFDSIKGVERNPYRLHWSSSWDRGLDNVLYLWPFIKKQIPEAELHVFYGCQTWKASCQQRNDQEGLKKIAEIEKGMKLPGVFNRGRVGQKDLAIELKKSSLLLYPQWFSETYFITGVEAQYAGVPVICNRYAGVTTTFKHPELGDTAIMLGNGDPWWPYSKEGREQFLVETVSILKDKDKWKEWSEKGTANTKRYSWKNCALRWKQLFEDLC
jgi:GT2 family glycosyltransferase/glycosyltransferase involved in cell wall biosynthesis